MKATGSRSCRNKRFGVILRIYGAPEAWFDETWKPGDLGLID